MMRVLLIAIVFLGAMAGLLVNEVERRWSLPLTVSEQGYHLTVTPGQRFRSVVDELVDEGVVEFPIVLLGYARYTGLDAQIKRGEYQLPHGTTGLGLLQILTAGEVIQYQVTLPEGITLSQAIAVLAEQEHLLVEIEGIEDSRLKALTASYASPEGLFFPDSYRFEKGTTDWQILQRAHQRMEAVLAQEWQGRDSKLPYELPYEALIMASIVERETGVASERQQIAGVFVSRLKKRMRLQTDPTVIYGLGDSFTGNLRRKHLQDSTNPYNTYRHGGLPPTPIALPGRAAIHAALHPGEGSALYFVAKGDGSHQFSDTLSAHQKAVRKYQLNRSSDYRSSPQRK